MEDLTKKRRLRGGQRSSTKKLVAKVVEAIPQLSNESPEEELVRVVKTEPDCRYRALFNSFATKRVVNDPAGIYRDFLFDKRDKTGFWILTSFKLCPT